MRFMNDFDIDQARLHHSDHPVLGPAIETISNLRDWANENSDGWSYWPKPARAAGKLSDLIMGDGTYAARQDLSRATPQALRAALSPVRSFRTRQGADFTIVSV